MLVSVCKISVPSTWVKEWRWREKFKTCQKFCQSPEPGLHRVSYRKMSSVLSDQIEEGLNLPKPFDTESTQLQWDLVCLRGTIAAFLLPGPDPGHLNLEHNLTVYDHLGLLQLHQWHFLCLWSLRPNPFQASCQAQGLHQLQIRGFLTKTTSMSQLHFVHKHRHCQNHHWHLV